MISSSLPPAQAKLNARAQQQLGRWRKTLTRKDRPKLKGDPLSKWAREGGSIVIVSRRRWRRPKKGALA